ncbi:MAG: hypothetical protein JW786_07900 [Desulfobacterales bacterium]|nr:hypothetical protein [Desulfobacterales bacterium]
MQHYLKSSLFKEARTEHGVSQSLIKRRIVAELFEQLGVIGQKLNHDSLQWGTVLDSRCFLVVILHGILAGRIGAYLLSSMGILFYSNVCQRLNE